MAEARKVFPMQTFVSFMRGKPGKYNKDVLELLSFMTQHEVTPETAPLASGLSKAWIYEQHPDLTRLKKEDIAEYGENVSVMPLPAEAMEEVKAVFKRVQGYKQTIAEQETQIKDLEAVKEENGKTIAALESKVNDYEKQMKNEGEKQIMASAKKVEDYLGKVDDLLAKIEEVKKHGVVSVSGDAAGGAASAGDDAAAGGSSEPEADFGFGSSPGGDEFGF